MTIQPARNYYSTERPNRREVGPPAPGQAYFGYPQPSSRPNSQPFPVPTQASPNPLFAPPPGQAQGQAQGRPIQPPAPGVAHLVTQPERWPVPSRRATDQRPYRAHQKPTRSHRQHWVGYPLVLILGLAIGVAVTFLH